MTSQWGPIGNAAFTFMTLVIMVSPVTSRRRAAAAACNPRENIKLCGLEILRCLSTVCLLPSTQTGSPSTTSVTLAQVSDTCCTRGCIPNNVLLPFC